MSYASRRIETNPSAKYRGDVLAACVEGCRRCEAACNDLMTAMAA